MEIGMYYYIIMCTYTRITPMIIAEEERDDVILYNINGKRKKFLGGEI